MPVIIVYRPPNTASLIFINDIEIILTKLASENRDIFMIGDFNYDTFKTSLFKPMNIESEILPIGLQNLICIHLYTSPP